MRAHRLHLRTAKYNHQWPPFVAVDAAPYWSRGSGWNNKHANVLEGRRNRGCFEAISPYIIFEVDV